MGVLWIPSMVICSIFCIFFSFIIWNICVTDMFFQNPVLGGYNLRCSYPEIALSDIQCMLGPLGFEWVLFKILMRSTWIFLYIQIFPIVTSDHLYLSFFWWRFVLIIYYRVIHKSALFPWIIGLYVQFDISISTFTLIQHVEYSISYRYIYYIYVQGVPVSLQGIIHVFFVPSSAMSNREYIQIRE